MTADQRDAMVATCIRALPDEGCGLLLGTSEGLVLEVVPSENAAHSARVYEIDSRVLLRAFRRADDDGVQVIGVFHSHTHSDPFPSPTDVAQAPDPAWHYVLVGLRDVAAVLKSYRIVEGAITAEEVTISH
ncbi:MAG TPA: M67 family metallopeptidase [Acidimicrobiales bacterium]|nr:M67 family metallopeptidase [Acidimicrobiales bacterium]